MDEHQFETWMKRMAPLNGGRNGSAEAIWWRAQLRRRLETEVSAVRPVRIVEGAAGFSCWLLAAIAASAMGTGALVSFLGLSVVVASGLQAITVKGD